MIDEGYYDVVLKKPSWQKMKKKDGDDSRMQAVLPGCTPEGDYLITAYLPATRTIIQSGGNSGRQLSEVTMETLESLGMSSGDPTKIGELDGKTVSFKVVVDDYGDEPKMKVAFVDPLRETMKDDEIKKVWAELNDGSSAASVPINSGASEDPFGDNDAKEPKDDIPF